MSSRLANWSGWGLSFAAIRRGFYRLIRLPCGAWEGELQNDFLTFIRELARELTLHDEPLADSDRQAIERAKEALRAVYERYQEAAPAGTEGVREGMLEALELFYDAVEILEAVDDGDDVALLAGALEKAEEASDILEQVEYLIEQASV